MADEDPSGFGPLLRQLRTASGLTQEALAEAAGLSARGIQELERGDHQPYRETLGRLVRALDLGGEDARRLSAVGRPRCRRPSEQASPSEPLETRRDNLPAELTSFVGREHELAQIRDLLDRTRLLTLTGPGGCGKTRLARRVAGEMVGACPDGVWLVELAPIAGPGLVARRVASSLPLRERPGETIPDALRAGLRERRLLLVLDNCEHVVEECAELAEWLLRACPGIRVLTTSREALGVSGEVTMQVPPLRVPDCDQTADPEDLTRCDAVALLVERAQAVRPTFRVTPENAPAVAEVVTRLDGVPLALELAAARLQSLSIQQLAARLDEPFSLLACGPRTAPLRQRTLREAVDWSYRLLNDRERALFRRLAPLGACFSLEAAEAACADVDDVLDLLSSLVRKSLVLVEEATGETRYRLLAAVREYARARQAEADEVAHASEWVPCPPRWTASDAGPADGNGRLNGGAAAACDADCRAPRAVACR